jgi:hypothetical protein
LMIWLEKLKSQSELELCRSTWISCYQIT